MTGLDFAAINAVALSSLPDLVRSELPDGRMRGVEWACRNPHRTDKRIGSFTINTRTGVWKDFASGDGGSDPISLFAFARQIGQGEAARELASMFGIDSGSDWAPGPRPAPKPQPPAWTTTTRPTPSKSALKIWGSGRPIAGTVGEAYLRSRAITIDPGPWVRFHPDLPYWHPGKTKDDPPRLLNRGPTLLLAAHYGDDLDIVAVHRVYLTGDARKLVLPDPDEPGEWLDPKKITNGYRGAHLKLGRWPVSDGIEVAASEGPENALCLAQALDMPALCSIAASNLPLVRIPLSVRSAIVGADPDSAGIMNANKGQISFAQQGAETRVIHPPEGAGDWNDVLRADEGIEK